MPSATSLSPTPVRLRADGRETHNANGRAIGVTTTPRPRLSWVVPLERDGQRQTGYRIVVSTTKSPVAAPDIWDSGVVDSEDNSGIVWLGAELPPHARFFWSVSARDEHGLMSEWAEAVSVESSAYERSDWIGDWIAPPASSRVAVTIPGYSTIDRARLSVAGWGSVRLAIGEEIVNDGELAPTDASLLRATARSYDVTDLLGDDPRELSFVASLGHYRHILDAPRLLVELRVHFTDGSSEVVGASVDEWRMSTSRITTDDPFYLEEHDLRTLPVAATRPVPAVLPCAIPPSPDVVSPNAGPPVQAVRTVAGRLIGRPAAGVAVFDLGENVAGRVELTLGALPSGCRVTSTQGEKLTGAGRVDTMNIRLPDDRDRERQVFAIISAGEPVTVSPWFALHGFRYVEVAGLPDAAPVEVSARVIHSDVERTGWLSTSHPQLDAIVDYAVRTQLNNTHGLPEDCPTREQGGWTGDASVSCEAALSHLDLTGVYRNWLVDLALDSDDEGGVPGIAPQLQGEFGSQPADPVWGSAMTEIPWQIWRHTGETWPIEPLLPTLRHWADWQIGTLVDGVVRKAGISFGADWLAPAQTPPVLLQTGAVVVSLRALADLEEAVGDGAAARDRRARADSIVDAARLRLRDPLEHSWGNDSQGSSATALAARLADDTDVDVLRSRLSADVRKRGDRLSTGFAATRSAVRALAEIDGGSTLLDMVQQPEQPGIGSMLVDGPGTFWETWWIDDENVGVASLDHIGLGAPFAAWVWSHVAGLRILEPGFRRFAIEPRLTGRVTRASFTRETPRGTVHASWTVESGRFLCEVTVPVGATAEVRTPGGEILVVDSGHHIVSGATAVDAVFATPPAPPARVAQGQTWLSDGVSSTWISADRSTVSMLETTVVCTPVYHEPIEAPILEVVVPDFAEGVDDVLILDQDGPLDLGDARFVFAHFDTDNSSIVGRAIRIFLRMRSSDGSIVESTVRPLPIAWNRVALDVEQWAGRASIVEVAVGVRWTDEPDSAFGPLVPLPPAPRSFSYKVGRVGWSNGPITY